jgi:hypothetical protein
MSTNTMAEAEKEVTSNYKPLLYYVSGLILTSVALVTAAMATLKDAWTVEPLKIALLSFLDWMAITIVLATVVMAFLQCRRCYFIKEKNGSAVPNRWDYIITLPLTVLPCVWAALQLIALAIGNFWWPF